ncbi:MAG: hypothetical protein ABGY95_11305 [Rubritalea sp.]|uniref:hypothetical protein n=1 Tax=Rubritalea sp. TaxID=2109375 RepID=UPI003242AD09
MMLRVVGGKVHEGAIQFVRNESIYFKTSEGSVVRISMASLNPAGKKMVGSWIWKQGGSKEYASWIGTTDQSFSKPWPRTVYGPTSIQLKKVQSLSKKKLLIYESSHYRFLINTKVEPRVIQRFAVLFEATHKFVFSLPINASGHYMEKGSKFPIYLFGDFASYYRAGGPQGSAGVYMPRNQSVLVPMPVLGVRWTGRKWEYEKRVSNRVLSHELTHQLCAGPAFASWYIEGGAEYVASTRYTHGVYHSNNGKQRVFDYVRDKDGLDDGSGRRLGSRIAMMQLEDFMKLPYAHFSGGRDANKNYGVGLLLTYYFYHHDGGGEAKRVKQYIKAVQLGKGERAAQKLLLAGRSYAQLQEEFRKFCAKGGINLEFAKK